MEEKTVFSSTYYCGGECSLFAVIFLDHAACLLNSERFLFRFRSQCDLLSSLIYHKNHQGAMMYITNPGQSHLINPSQNFQQILIAPASLETFGFDPQFGALLVSKQIESQVTEYC